MAKMRLAFVTSVIIMLVATSLFPTSAECCKRLIYRWQHGANRRLR